MRVADVDEARALARKVQQKIYVQVANLDGVLEVYPGGRAIYWAGDMPVHVLKRKLALLTPDEVLNV